MGYQEKLYWLRFPKFKNTFNHANMEQKADGPGFVGIWFCQECNNMFYPKEDKENKR